MLALVGFKIHSQARERNQVNRAMINKYQFNNPPIHNALCLGLSEEDN